MPRKLTHNMWDISGLLETDQQSREFLQERGFIPLCEVQNSEIWIRDGRYLVLGWRGNMPEYVPPLSLTSDHIENGQLLLIEYQPPVNGVCS